MSMLVNESIKKTSYYNKIYDNFFK